MKYKVNINQLRQDFPEVDPESFADLQYMELSNVIPIGYWREYPEQESAWEWPVPEEWPNRKVFWRMLREVQRKIPHYNTSGRKAVMYGKTETWNRITGEIYPFGEYSLFDKHTNKEWRWSHDLSLYVKMGVRVPKKFILVIDRRHRKGYPNKH